MSRRRRRRKAGVSTRTRRHYGADTQRFNLATGLGTPEPTFVGVDFGTIEERFAAAVPDTLTTPTADKNFTVSPPIRGFGKSTATAQYLTQSINAARIMRAVGESLLQQGFTTVDGEEFFKAGDK